MVPNEPLSLVMLYGPYQSGEACGVVQKGTPYMNVATLFFPPLIFVAPDTDHGAAYTWHWIFPRCRGPVGGHVGFIK